MSKEKKNTLTIVLFMIYVLALIWIILLKLQFSFTEIDRVRSINLIPLQGSVIINGIVSLNEIFDNIIVFIPFGIYINMLKNKWSFIQKVLPIISVSLTFEVLQFIFAIGRTDITDLLGNTLGGIIGIFIYAVLLKIFKNKTIKIINTVALILTVCALALITLLLIAN